MALMRVRPKRARNTGSTNEAVSDMPVFNYVAIDGFLTSSVMIDLLCLVFVS